MSARKLLRQGAGLPRRAAILLVRLYQATLSPLIGCQCRFQPTCSNYFIEALERNGLFRGTVLGLWRILRCHPLAGGGYDPVDAPARPGAKGAGETPGAVRSGGGPFGGGPGREGRDATADP